MGHHDQRGVDLFSFGCELADDTSGRSYDFVVQCKGVEDLAFGRDDVAAALKSVEKYQQAGFRARTYWLVLNRPIMNNEWRTRLDEGIEGLTRTGVARQAEWLEAHELLRRVLLKLVDRSRIRIASRNAEELGIYEHAMGHVLTYVHEVPFVGAPSQAPPIAASQVAGRGAPSEYIRAALRPPTEQRQGGAPTEKGQRIIFVISEFGSGKTLLLLQLTRTLILSGHIVLYQPIVELSPTCFDNEFALVAGIYELLFGEDEPVERTAHYPPLFAFREVVRSEQGTVLVLDGIDEHRMFYSVAGLRSMFGSVASAGCDVIFAVRREFWDSYGGNISTALAERWQKWTRVELREWDRISMEAFLAPFPGSRGVDALRARVHAGTIEQFYGDIPRRPLFLHMLAGELAEDADAAANLSSLYARYVQSKMKRDVTTPFRRASDAGRPVPEEHTDLDVLWEKLVELQEIVAGRSLEAEDAADEWLLRGEITEADVRAATAEVGLERLDYGQLVQHTLLMPSGGSKRRGGNRFRFAHRSFQEYFAAVYVFRSGVRNGIWRGRRLPKGCLDFANWLSVS
jgi:hypothetical protein